MLFVSLQVAYVKISLNHAMRVIIPTDLKII